MLSWRSRENDMTSGDADKSAWALAAMERR
jgi:hypothetical protein